MSDLLLLDGQPVSINTPAAAIRHGIGMIHQHFMLVPQLTVTENIILGCGGGLHLDLRSQSQKITKLSQTYGLEVPPLARVEDLPVGIQQRVEILKVLYRQARILILDEPTAVLAPAEIQGFLETLKQLASRNHTIIFISHKLDEVMAVCDQVTILRRGKQVASCATADTSRAALARLMVDWDVEINSRPEPQPAGQVVLDIRELWVTTERQVEALRGLSLQVRSGEIVGIAGGGRQRSAGTGGLDWGIPNLNFRRWCAACYGDEYWQRIHYIPRLLWADYLDWYATVLALPIQHHTDITDIHWQADEQCFWLQTWRNDMPELQKARFIIFATGLDNAGGKNIPEIVQASLPQDCYHHTMDRIDFSSMAEQRVGIIGGGASAFDNAILALRAGAKSVDIMIRRPQLPNLNRIRWSEWNGFHRHFIDLPDAMKWAYSLAELRTGQLPPPHTYYQAISHPRLTLYTHAPVQQLSYTRGGILGQYGELKLRHDVLICGTGFVTDLDMQSGLKTLAPDIVRWCDRYTPPPGDEHAEMARYPYLGSHLEFLPRLPEQDYLSRCYYLSSGAALLSIKTTSGLPTMPMMSKNTKACFLTGCMISWSCDRFSSPMQMNYLP